MKQKKVSFNQTIEVKEFRKDDKICSSILINNKSIILKFIFVQIIFISIIILNYNLNFYDKVWSHSSLVCSLSVGYFIINYNYDILQYLHPLWVPLMTGLSFFLTNRYLLLESLWFILTIQIAWMIFDGCILCEKKEEWNQILSKLIQILALLFTVVLTNLISK
jgi:hypothetical protein